MTGISTSLREYVALEVNGQVSNLQEVLRFAKWGSESHFIRKATDVALIRHAALERGVRVTDEELQQAADQFRSQRDLSDARKTEHWLDQNHLSQVEWECFLEDDVIRLKLRDLLTAGKVERYFAEHRLLFDAATISRLVVKDECVARELRAQIVEEGADFYNLARKYSIDLLTRPAGGYAGLVRRSEMLAAMEAAVFGAQPGKTVSPVKTYAGWELVKVEALHLAKLDDSMIEAIKSLLFDEWLSDRRRKAKIRIPLLECDSNGHEMQVETKRGV